MDGQDTATGLLTPVLQRPSSIQGCKRGKYIILGGDRFPGDRMGGTCLERAIGGGWPLTETRHINLLELPAVVLLLQHCKPLLQGTHVLVRSDKRTTVAYINRQDGVGSAALLSAAENLWLWASENVFISEGPPHSGTGEKWGRSHVKRRAPARRMVAPPGSVGQSTPHVCTRAMAKIAALRLFTAASHSPTPGGGETRTVVGHSGSPRSPLGAVVHRSDTDDGGPALDSFSVPGALSQEVGALGALPTQGQPLQAWLLRGTG